MSRWAEAFAALSGGADTLDTMRHPGEVSNSVNSVIEPPTIPEPVVWGDPEDERAAIVEHDGAIPREWTEGFARLDPDRPPRDVPPARWQRFVNDVGLFLDRWAASAAALGWGPHDLFGCDRDRPLTCTHQSGLLYLLNGDKLVALSQTTAGVKTRTGKHLTYCRRPSKPGRVLAWELV